MQSAHRWHETAAALCDDMGHRLTQDARSLQQALSTLAQVPLRLEQSARAWLESGPAGVSREA